MHTMIPRTYSPKEAELYADWHVIDAGGRPLGRVATEAAHLLRGKHKPTFAPHMLTGDFVIIVNAGRVAVTGNKEKQKNYYTHSMYPGGLRTTDYSLQMERHPTRAVEHAIKGMLPHNRLGAAMYRRLKVYAGATHPHEAQVNAGPRKVRAEVAQD